MLIVRFWFALGAALLLVAGALGVAAAATPAAAQSEVTIRAGGPPPQFSPANVTVPVGTRVTWIVESGNHSSTSVDGLWDSGVGGPGTTVSYTFNTPGTFDYYCTPHRAAGMVGRVTVVAASAAQASGGAQAPSALPRTGGVPLIAGALATALLGVGSFAAGFAVRHRKQRQDS